MKTGLVLEGGAMRGMFTAGVLDSWMDEQISFDGIVGVSAGALFGINAPAGQKGRAIRYNLKYIRDKRYMGADQLHQALLHGRADGGSGEGQAVVAVDGALDAAGPGEGLVRPQEHRADAQQIVGDFTF